MQEQDGSGTIRKKLQSDMLSYKKVFINEELNLLSCIVELADGQQPGQKMK